MTSVAAGDGGRRRDAASGPPRLAVVGAGWWSANHHVPSLAGYAGAELVALCDPDRDRAEALAAEHGVARVVTDVEDLVGLVDAAVVATPHDTHHELAGRLVDAGVHVLVEKPLTTTGADAADLVRRAEGAGVHLAVGYTDQYTEVAARVRRAVQEEIGELVQVVAEFASSTGGLFARAEGDGEGGDGGGDAGGRHDDDPHDQHAGTYAAEHGGGQAHTQLTHVLGMVCWATGRQVAEVAAFVDHRGLETDVDDVVALRFTGGGTGVVASTGMAGDAHGVRHHVRYLGTRGTVDQDMLADRMVLRREDGDLVVEGAPVGAEPDGVPRTWLPARRFADVVAGRSDSPAPGRAGAATAAAIEALLTAAGTGAVVQVPQVP